MDKKRSVTKKISIDRILNRDDVWKGSVQQHSPKKAIDTGHSNLNKALLNHGWPTSSLIEINHSSYSISVHSPNKVDDTFVGAGIEWLLFSPCISRYCNRHGYIALLNPPAQPFAPGFINNNIPLQQLLVIESRAKNDFIASFTELAHSTHCKIVIAWQQQYNFSYTELRKCQLASSSGHGIYFLFRPCHTPYHTHLPSSPAALRLWLTRQHDTFALTIFKQRGSFYQETIDLRLPPSWQAYKAHHQLDTPISNLSSQHPNNMPIKKSKHEH